MTAVDLSDPRALALVGSDVVREPRAPRPRGFVEPTKRLLVTANVVQLFGECVAEKDARAVVGVGTRDARFELADEIGVRRLHAHLRPQQPARVLRIVEREPSIAGRLGPVEATETAFAAGEVVRKSGVSRRELGRMQIQSVRTLMPTQSHRYESKCVVGISDARAKPCRVGGDLLGVFDAAELQQNRCEQTVRRRPRAPQRGARRRDDRPASSDRPQRRRRDRSCS